VQVRASRSAVDSGGTPPGMPGLRRPPVSSEKLVIVVATGSAVVSIFAIVLSIVAIRIATRSEMPATEPTAAPVVTGELPPISTVSAPTLYPQPPLGETEVPPEEACEKSKELARNAETIGAVAAFSKCTDPAKRAEAVQAIRKGAQIDASRHLMNNECEKAAGVIRAAGGIGIVMGTESRTLEEKRSANKCR
jgi:hypothetical protein